MVLNYIWVAFFGIAFLIAAGKLVFAGDAGVFPAIMDSTFSSAKTAFEISLGLTGVLSLWMGIMKIGEKGWSGPHSGTRSQPALLQTLPGHSQEPSRHRKHFHEHLCQYVGTGQCGHAVRA